MCDKNKDLRVDGFLFEVGDFLDLSKAICRILQRPEERVEIQNNTDIWKRQTYEYVNDIEQEYYSNLRD